MSDPRISTYPSMAALEARRDASLWSPGLRLIGPRGPRFKGLLLLLLSWLGIALLALLALQWQPTVAAAGAPGEGLRFEPLRSMVDAAGPHLHWLSPGVVGVALLAVLYLAVCAWMSMAEPPAASTPRARDAASSPERDALPPQRSDTLHGAEHDLADIHLALRLGQHKVATAIGETARRTIALCGAFDSCGKHVEVAGADLDAVQDEASHAQQVMVGLRAHLLALGGYGQSLGSVVQRLGATAIPAEAAQQVDTLLEALHAELAHCHQLSERIGGAERCGERRIESIRRCIDGLGFQADRGLREGHQVMVLTRQIEAAVAEGTQQLDRLAAIGAGPTPVAAGS